MTDQSFETIFTSDYVRQSVPAGCRILEVGAGAGELAAVLVGDGFQVVALDIDPDAVETARERGVDARVAQWPEALDERFDAVLFTRSLHHIQPLDESVAAGVACLKPGGRIVVEDFDVEAADEQTLAWFAGSIRLLHASGLLPGQQQLLNDLPESDGLLATWRRHHDHDLHGVAAMEGELRGQLTDVIIERVPYFFRYLGAGMAMANARERNDLVRSLAEQEGRLIADGRITALGWRLRGTVGAVLAG